MNVTMQLPRLLILVATAMTLTGASPADEKWVVTVKAFDPFGKELPIRRSEILTIDYAAVVAKSESGTTNVVHGVRFGEFILRVHSSGGSVGTRRISISRSKHYIQLGLPIRFGDSIAGWPSYALRVKLAEQVDSKRLWVAAQGVFLDSRKEALDSGGGLFVMEGLDMGIYLVQVFQGKTLLHVETVEIVGKGDQEVTISTLNLIKK